MAKAAVAITKGSVAFSGFAGPAVQMKTIFSFDSIIVVFKFGSKFDKKKSTRLAKSVA
jgi:hypothetical protein